jgi:hypothetical protein
MKYEIRAYEPRPCLFPGTDSTWKKGLFHRWFEEVHTEYDFISNQHITKPRLKAVVEDEDGTIWLTDSIRFVDSKGVISQYDYTLPPVITEDELRKILSGEDSAKNT